MTRILSISVMMAAIGIAGLCHCGLVNAQDATAEADINAGAAKQIPATLPAGPASQTPVPIQNRAPGNVDPIAAAGLRPSPQLFSQYYAHSHFGGQPAQMYVSPLPVPQFTGHTYYTYQPFYPHEMLYPHYREYYNYHSLKQAPGVGYTAYNHTQVRWQRGGLRTTNFRRLINGREPHIQYWKYGNGMPVPGVGGEVQVHAGYAQ